MAYGCIALTCPCSLAVVFRMQPSSTLSISAKSWALTSLGSSFYHGVAQEPLPPGVIKGPYSLYRPGPHWHGWSSTSHVIVFGDSWTMTDYHPDGERATIENPLGNPGWPGITSTAGPNWVGYLTYKFNDSVVLAANFAVGGATIDYKLIRQGVPHFGPSDFRAQIVNRFGGGYLNNDTYAWQPDTSLFVIWMGINDIHEQDESTYDYFAEIFELFAARIDILYQYGARNFAFLNVPPLERAPLAGRVEGEYDRLLGLVTGWNKNLTSLVWNLTSTYEDVTAFVLDTYQLYNDVLAKPCVLPQSCELVVLEGYCPKCKYAHMLRWQALIVC